VGVCVGYNLVKYSILIEGIKLHIVISFVTKILSQVNASAFYSDIRILSYFGYSIISESDRVITFGGYCHLSSPKILDTVTQFKNDEWTLIGLGYADILTDIL